jgi:Zn-dependent protease
MDLLGGSFRIGQFLGITVRVHMLFLLFFAFRVLDGMQHGGLWDSVWFMLMIFGIVLVHEYGHCLGARSVGGDAREILLWPLGGLAFAHAPMRPWPQFVTVACGPLVNVAFCIISAAVLITATGELGVVSWNPYATMGTGMTEQWHWYLLLFYRINLYLLCFNLLPIYPLDGGQLFQTIMWPFMGLQRSTIVACHVGLAGAALLAFWGIQGGGFVLVAIAIFGGMTSWQRLQLAQRGMLVDESMATYGHLGRPHKKRSLFSRWWQRASRPGPRPGGGVNPNPGGWERRMEEEDRVNAEVDRILQKVHDNGIQSLSYVERQTLERATRDRQQRERQYQND